MKFRKKPIEIEAEQFFMDCSPWPDGVVFKPKSEKIKWCGTYGIETLEGFMRVSDRDWIIKGIRGELYPCKPDIFEATYEPVSAKEIAERENR